jgi:hypothetical protein
MVRAIPLWEMRSGLSRVISWSLNRICPDEGPELAPGYREVSLIDGLEAAEGFADFLEG